MSLKICTRWRQRTARHLQVGFRVEHVTRSLHTAASAGGRRQVFRIRMLRRLPSRIELKPEDKEEVRGVQSISPTRPTSPPPRYCQKYNTRTTSNPTTRCPVSCNGPPEWFTDERGPCVYPARGHHAATFPWESKNFRTLHISTVAVLDLSTRCQSNKKQFYPTHPGRNAEAKRQGLTLVHFSAQL